MINLNIRPFFTGIIAGVLSSIALALPWYFILPARYTDDWYNFPAFLEPLGYILAGLVALASGYVSARWGWAETLRRRITMGALAGVVTGAIAWLLVGAATAGVVGHEPIWLHGPRQAGEDGLLILLSEAVVRSGVLPHLIFWILLVTGVTLGGVGGLATIWKRSASWGTAPRPIHRSVWLAVAFSLFLISTLMLPVTMGILIVLTHQVESVAFKTQHTLSFPAESILWLPVFVNTLTLILSLVWGWKQIGDWRAHPHSDSTRMVATMSAFMLFIPPLLWFYLILVNPALVSGTNVLVPVTVIALNLMGGYWAWIATSEGPSAVAVPDMTWRDWLAYVFLAWPLCSIVFMLGVSAHAISLVLGAITFIGVLTDGTDIAVLRHL